MGGCATKPKVIKDDATAAAPEPEPEPKPVVKSIKPDTIVETRVVEKEKEKQGGDVNNNVDDDDQSTKQRSLSLLFNKEVRTQISHSIHILCCFFILLLSFLAYEARTLIELGMFWFRTPLVFVYWTSKHYNYMTIFLNR
jgi:hypothetical protein